MLNVRPGHGAVALDIQQQLDAIAGWSVIDGLEVTPDSEFTVSVDPGTALCNSTLRTPDSQTVTLEFPDPEFPRRDVIYLNQFADAQVEPGEPNPILPEGSTRFDSFSPWPYSMFDIGSTVLAEVWVEPGSTEIVTDDIRLRRIPASRTLGDVTAQSLSVESEPTDGKDVMRLTDFEERTDESTIRGGTLGGNIDANGFNIIDIGQATADNFLVNNPSQEATAVVTRQILQNYYQLSGDSLSGDMDANQHNINDVDKMDASGGSFSNYLEIPEVNGIPDKGHLWINRDNL